MKRKNLKKMKKQIAGAFTVLFLAIAQFVYTEYFAPEPSSPERQIVTLDKCVDGDTAWFKISGERVKSRFLYIDTPESTNKKEYMGKEASEYTKNQLQNASSIEIEFNADGDQYDKYDRALLWVFVDGQLLQEKIARAGFVKKYYDYGYDYKYKDIIIKADEEARKEKVGLYQ